MGELLIGESKDLVGEPRERIILRQQRRLGRLALIYYL
jgi:hypothetical protein